MPPPPRRLRPALGAVIFLIAAWVPTARAVTPAPSPAAQAPPYQDQGVNGGIGLCSPDRQPVTHGTLAAEPFIGYAVSSVPAPAGYVAQRGTAQLLAFQPIQGQDPRTWQGEVLTAPTTFSEDAHPTAAMTATDGSLNAFLRDYSPGWGGYIQLRLYLGRTLNSQPVYSAADILVGVDTWTLVDGAAVPCGAGTAVSAEVATLVSPAAASPSRAPTPAAASRQAGAAERAPLEGKGSGPGSWFFPGLVVLGLLLLVARQFLPGARRRRSTRHAPPR